ncbi:hypothetical protein [Metabacillus sp. B2-18]|nr:hypothetical protein [Metabacillus sp. B2-18]
MHESAQWSDVIGYINGKYSYRILITFINNFDSSPNFVIRKK